MKNIILIAPPAAGKGTQGALISNHYNIPHISTGKLLREVADEKIESDLKSGMLLSDELVLGLLETRLKKEDCRNGFILDGFPRNLKQVAMYEKLMDKLKLSLGIVLFITVDHEIALKRIEGRQECLNCSAIYNTNFDSMKPKVNNICDKCGSKLSRRVDDNVDTYKKRYEQYLKETYPVVQYFQTKGLIKVVESDSTKELTFEKVKKFI